MAAMNTLPVPEPVFVLRYNLKDITHDITAYATSITFTDKLSGESDELEVELEDSEQRWRDAWYPGMGDTLALQLGFQGMPLTDCGGFSIDEIELFGPPDSVSIRGRSAPVTRAMRTKSNRGFENTTLAAIAGRIARKHKLKLEGQIEPLTLERITQYGESDLAFLKRLANDYGYMVKVTPEKLIFSHLGKLRDAPVIRTITPQEVSRWTLRDTLHEVYKGVKNKHQNSQTRTLVTFNADNTTTTRTEKKSSSSGMSTSSDIINTSDRAQNAEEASAKGKAKLDSKNEYKHAGTLSLEGDLSLRAGGSVTLSGFGKSDGKWLIISARHSLARSSGLTTDIDIARGLKHKAGKGKKQARTLTVFKADNTTEQVKADKGIPTR
ncbi:phage protein D [Salmonella enterica]|uniref:Phage protein D n=1 Tax=Salmonella newport TaxID=108619 RepID=A0A5U9VFY8_SALNE|nr:phage protein D [Salmonella enterica subsp. enterica]EAY8717306.1 phage protein D [Salmonella enterica]EBS4544829.1 phage protein D [Salmonella enterica subsp. enterica serovar Newport]ECI2267025.1 phage protein D [Salmonella enterica subsp. enterica serovar Wandsworth]EDH7692027.1 phage protein D [Salmonella enterica subsp. enterica serovar Stanley]